jgi:hypothetical protein
VSAACTCHTHNWNFSFSTKEEKKEEKIQSGQLEGKTGRMSRVILIPD